MARETWILGSKKQKAAASEPPPLELPIVQLLDLPYIQTLVPEADPITLSAYYPHMRQYYINCEPQTKRWCVRNIGRDWRIFDVGANIGYYSILFGRCALEGSVVAYEPTETARMTARNLALNGITNVEICELALGHEAGDFNAALYRIWGELPEKKIRSFSTVDLEIKRLGWNRLDLLKIDVDSFDFDVLRGAIETLDRLDPWVLVELNHALAQRGHGVGEVLDWLAAQGYSTARVLDNENFLLRRGGKLHRQSRGELKLRFESEPVYLSPRWHATNHSAAKFAGPPQAGPSGQLKNKDSSVHIKGPAWSYGVILPMHPIAQGRAIVQLEISVTGAEVGVLCVSEGYSRLIGQEVFVQPGPNIQIEIHIDQVEYLAAVVIRKGQSPVDVAEVRFSQPKAWLAQASSNIISNISTDPSVSSIAFAQIATGLAEIQNDIHEAHLNIINVESLGNYLGQNFAMRPPLRTVDIPLTLFRMENHDALILAQIYRMHLPKRHLEFGTWQGFGASICAQNSDAHIWTINLPDGEKDASGNPVYYDCNGLSDAQERIGHLYRAAGFADRVTQLLIDSRDLNVQKFSKGFFDSVLIDGGHSREIVTSDTDNAIYLTRAGGLVLWHDFCPDPAVLQNKGVAQGVVTAVLSNWLRWQPYFKEIFWIRPSWILLGIRNERQIEI